MWLSFLWHYVFSRRAGSLIRVISWLALMGIFVGVAAFVIVMSVMNGFNDSIKTRYLAAEPHLVVTSKKPELLQNASVELKKNPAVQSVDWVENQDVILKTDYGVFSRAIAKGMDRKTLAARLFEVRETFYKNHAYKYAKKDIPALIQQDVDFALKNLEAGTVLVGRDLAQYLSVVAGDRLLVVQPEVLLLPPEMAPQASEVFIAEFLVSEVGDTDANYVWYERGKTLASLGKALSREVGLEVRLHQPSEFADLQRQLKSEGLQVESWQDRNAALFFALRLEKTTIGTFLLISALITCCSILIVMVLLIAQKRNDMGILMTMGFSRREATRLFARLGFALSCVGSLSGLGFGVLVGLLLEANSWEILPDIYYDATLPARVDFVNVLGLGVVVLAFSYVMAYLPSYYLSQVLPAQSLRRNT